MRVGGARRGPDTRPVPAQAVAGEAAAALVAVGAVRAGSGEAPGQADPHLVGLPVIGVEGGMPELRLTVRIGRLRKVLPSAVALRVVEPVLEVEVAGPLSRAIRPAASVAAAASGPAIDGMGRRRPVARPARPRHRSISRARGRSGPRGSVGSRPATPSYHPRRAGPGRGPGAAPPPPLRWRPFRLKGEAAVLGEPDRADDFRGYRLRRQQPRDPVPTTRQGGEHQRHQRDQAQPLDRALTPLATSHSGPHSLPSSRRSDARGGGSSPDP